MTEHPSNSVEFSRTFFLIDQDGFAALSGDYNPIHVDPVAARRTIMGEPVVHGIHLVLCALEHIAIELSAQQTPFAIVYLRANFPKPALVGDLVSYRIDSTDCCDFRIIASVGLDCVLDSELKLEASSQKHAKASYLPITLEKKAIAIAIEQVSRLKGTIPLFLSIVDVHNSFPACLEVLGHQVLADLFAFTRLVGMHCPGLQSVFGKFEVHSYSARGFPDLTFNVEEVDERFSLVRIRVAGCAFTGLLHCFFRPAETIQSSTVSLASRVGSDRFKDSIALIVGGTRGLGEITAKIIAAGGGKTIITYNQGFDDARRVASDISDAGYNCDIMHLDTRNCAESIKGLFSSQTAPLSIYYFASPRIFVRRRNFFNYPLLLNFTNFYVNYFTTLIDAAAEVSQRKLRIFSPSSVAVEDGLRDLTEYSMAKRTAEDVCRHYNQHSNILHIITERLPRVRTDQTATIVSYPAEEPFDVMFPIIKRMEHLT